MPLLIHSSDDLIQSVKKIMPEGYYENNKHSKIYDKNNKQIGLQPFNEPFNLSIWLESDGNKYKESVIRISNEIADALQIDGQDFSDISVQEYFNDVLRDLYLICYSKKEDNLQVKVSSYAATFKDEGYNSLNNALPETIKVMTKNMPALKEVSLEWKSVLNKIERTSSRYRKESGELFYYEEGENQEMELASLPPLIKKENSDLDKQRLSNKRKRDFEVSGDTPAGSPPSEMASLKIAGTSSQYSSLANADAKEQLFAKLKDFQDKRDLEVNDDDTTVESPPSSDMPPLKTARTDNQSDVWKNRVAKKEPVEKQEEKTAAVKIKRVHGF